MCVREWRGKFSSVDRFSWQHHVPTWYTNVEEIGHAQAVLLSNRLQLDEMLFQPWWQCGCDSSRDGRTIPLGHAEFDSASPNDPSGTPDVHYPPLKTNQLTKKICFQGCHLCLFVGQRWSDVQWGRWSDCIVGVGMLNDYSQYIVDFVQFYKPFKQN